MDDLSNEKSVELHELRLWSMLPTPTTSRPTRFQTLTLNDIIALLSSDRHKTFIFYSEQATAEAAFVTSSTATEQSDPSAANEDETSLANDQCSEFFCSVAKPAACAANMASAAGPGICPRSHFGHHQTDGFGKRRWPHPHVFCSSVSR